MIDQSLGFSFRVSRSRAPGRMGIRISSGNVRLIKLEGRVHEFVAHFEAVSQHLQKIRHRMSPRLSSDLLEYSLYGLLRRLLRRETRPFKITGLKIVARMREINAGLIHPVGASFHEIQAGASWVAGIYVYEVFPRRFVAGLA